MLAMLLDKPEEIEKNPLYLVELDLPKIEPALWLWREYMTPIPQMDYLKHLYYEKTIRSVTASTRKDGEELLHLAAEVPIRTETTPFPLKEANKALQLLKNGKINRAGVLVIPEM